MKIELAGARLREIRRNAGMTLHMVATTLGVTVAAVSAWERGIAQPREELWPRIAGAYCCGTRTLVTALAVRPASRDEFCAVAEKFGVAVDVVLP